MQLILRILIAAGGALFTFMAADFLIQPEQAASGLDMAPTSLTGLGAIRGDMTRDSAHSRFYAGRGITGPAYHDGR